MGKAENFWGILGLVSSGISIIVSILCWRFVYSNIKKYNKYASRLYNVDFSKEGAFQKFSKIVRKIYKLEKSGQKLQIDFSYQKNINNKIAKEDVVAVLYNVCMNALEYLDDNKSNKTPCNAAKSDCSPLEE